MISGGQKWRQEVALWQLSRHMGVNFTLATLVCGMYGQARCGQRMCVHAGQGVQGMDEHQPQGSFLREESPVCGFQLLRSLPLYGSSFQGWDSFPPSSSSHSNCPQFSSVAQSCPIHCDPMNCSKSGLPVHHHLTQFTQTHVHRVGDAIQPSPPLASPSPPAFNLSQHLGLFQ